MTKITILSGLMLITTMVTIGLLSYYYPNSYSPILGISLGAFTGYMAGKLKK